jgi:hypothetical protein
MVYGQALYWWSNRPSLAAARNSRHSARDMATVESGACLSNYRWPYLKYTREGRNNVPALTLTCSLREKLAPLFQGKLKDWTLRAACAADEDEFTMPGHLNTSCSLAGS